VATRKRGRSGQRAQASREAIVTAEADPNFLLFASALGHAQSLERFARLALRLAGNHRRTRDEQSIYERIVKMLQPTVRRLDGSPLARFVDWASWATALDRNVEQLKSLLRELVTDLRREKVINADAVGRVVEKHVPSKSLAARWVGNDMRAEIADWLSNDVSVKGKVGYADGARKIIARTWDTSAAAVMDNVTDSRRWRSKRPPLKPHTR
jgi:hypothetical protein